MKCENPLGSLHFPRGFHAAEILTRPEAVSTYLRGFAAMFTTLVSSTWSVGSSQQRRRPRVSAYCFTRYPDTATLSVGEK
jgi:hypothetical protein